MKKTILNFALLSFFLFLCGCGTADYEARLNNAASGASADSSFTAALNPETSIPGTSIGLCVPKVMKATEISDPIHGKFSVLEMPGLKATYEGSVGNDPNNTWHYYLHVFVSEMPASGTLPTRGWYNNLASQFPNAADSSGEVNKNYSVETPQGTTLEWEEIHYKCKQTFFYPKADNPQNVLNTEGVLVCLCRQENKMCVTLVYRYPKELADRHSTDFDADWIKLVAGTLNVKAEGG